MIQMDFKVNHTLVMNFQKYWETLSLGAARLLVRGTTGLLNIVLCTPQALRLCDPRRYLKSPQKSGHFDTSGSRVSLFVPEISQEVLKIQKSMN